ncbi:hypothetical protein CDGHABPJ_00280 [Pseudomonas phage OMKO1]|uniref:PHIKZ125 n=1 Tax=Pseudomonas phage phiKZ TaxID=2905945 RepID=Q8SD37_BPDPK|nr:PHIKZ125 [Pseudomonas phage phiKZ]AAL83026.1 PHIKZ125 [Pseudomonas phage phiKZ]USL86738.1 hypothetical protein CDGHABPJ_00280 [Pseudomonas phage OMKO1]WNV47824.1 hypothetical protein [Pseudomonas phage fMGyn-Pae01]BDR26689.1 hypothetical protein RVBP18_3440 [Pseudomonas phage sp. LC]
MLAKMNKFFKELLNKNTVNMAGLFDDVVLMNSYNNYKPDFNDTVEVNTKCDLPANGKVLVLYVVQDTMDMYIWDGQQYLSYNPYSTEQLAPMIDDPSAFIPSTKANTSLKVTYGIWALKKDLETIQKYSIGMHTLLDKHSLARVNDKNPINKVFFETCHKALYTALRESYKNNMVKPQIADAVTKEGCWFGRDHRSNKLSFKCGEFKVEW